MQTRSSDEKDVCPAVCLSVKRVNCDKMEERSPLQREILGHPLAPRWSEIVDFEPIFARSASAVTPSEKSSINTKQKFTTRFPMSLR